MKKTKLKPWTVKKSKQILKDKWIDLRADTCVNQKGAVYDPYYVFNVSDFVNLVVLDGKDNILVVRQYRHGIGKIMTELPCGTIDKEDKSSLVAAKRELLEEAGYTGKFAKTGKFHSHPSHFNNTVHCFLVTDAKLIAAPEEDPYELLEYEFIKLSQPKRMVDKGVFNQTQHITSLLMGLRKAGKVNLVF